MSRRYFFSTVFLVTALVTFFFFPSFVFASTVVSGAIDTDTTWTKAQSPYVIQHASVNQGITLIIEPGVVVKFQSRLTQMTIDGVLQVNGAPDDKVFFTSFKDDTVGGDTNEDGLITNPNAEDWTHIQFNAGSSGSISNAVIRYGGSHACTAYGCFGSRSAFYNNGTSLTISNSQFSYNNIYGIFHNNGSLTITNSELDHNTNGVWLSIGTTADISNNNFYDNNYGVVTSGSGSLALTLTNNTFTNNALGAASVSGSVDFVHFGNTASGTGRRGFVLGNRINADRTLNNDLPYIVTVLIVNAGKTLTIDPGVIIKFEGSPMSLTIDGSLQVNGTKDNIVYFTSLDDDAAGGDTNGNGDATLPQGGNWKHIRFNAGSTGNINYAAIRYGGWHIGIGSYVGLYNRGGNVHISHSEIDHNGSFFNFNGIYQESGNLTISDSSIHNHIYGLINSSLESPVQAINNWWGDVSGPYHPLLNPHGKGNQVSDNVNFVPWLGYDPGKNQLPTLSNLHQYKSDGTTDITEGTVTTQNSIIFKATLDDPDTDQVKLQIELRGIEEPFTGADDGGILISDFVPSGNQAVITKTDIVAGIYKWRARVIDDKGAMSEWQEFGIIGNSDFEVKLGNSSVVFLPGLEASRLYTRDTGCFIINCENQLWEPNRNDDVRKLYLSNTTGESIDSGVYTRDVIDEAFSINIYKNFLSFMDGLIVTDVISHFETLPYDWRDDQRDVVTRIIRLESGAYHIRTRIEEIASSSPTGKVTLITHSNGGLVAKELVEELKRQGKENLIDRIIMVAAPQLGTPEAIFEILHGTTFFLGFPNKEVIRELAENMKSAYTLLPSRTYFDRLGDPLIQPLIEFSTTTPVTESFRNIYGNSIFDYDTLRKFLRGENDTRIEPQASVVNEPNVLKENFLTNAEMRHAQLDTWIPPFGIDVIEIIGWGLDTPRGVKYGSVKKRVCNADLSVCSKIDVIDPQPLKTSEGDGTVVYPSVEAFGVKRYYVNINEYNEKGFTINRNHKNILEIEPLQDLIAMLIKHEDTSTLPLFISSTKPSETQDDKRLRISVHSPVALHLYDSLGRHTGIIPNPNPLSDLNLYEEQIPNSYYWQVGEGQYAGVDNATTTTIKLQGTDFGTFTIDIENIVNDITATTTIYEDIPVTASTTAILLIGDGTSTPLLLDIDGDGTIDASITTDGFATEDILGILKRLVKTLHLPMEKEKKLIKKIEKLEKELKKEYKNERTEKRKIGHAFEEIIKTIEKYEKKDVLTHDEAGELISIIGQINGEMIK